MSGAVWPAPAKLNLFLHVVGRRPDGYHDIQTVFQLIDLHDSLTFEPRPDAVIRRVEGPAEVPEAEDLCLRAACLLQEVAGLRVGVDIRLIKRIPLQGGLGGGSSDAATTLVALNELWEAGLGTAELARLGRELGADVPLFVHGRSAWGEGVGDWLTPIDLPERYFAIVYPGVGVATAEIFQASELTRNSPKTTIRGFLKAGGQNDCEPVVCGRNPEVARALSWLAARGGARLTGTGSCVFAPFDARGAAEAALTDLPAGWAGYVARGLDRSPLLERLAAERSSHDGVRV
ncbi:MAG: 4-(cytidine 5'-diphospho)-2-C-methyl-D-erythritol kinase [Steroidobacteraceae bacterium]